MSPACLHTAWHLGVSLTRSTLMREFAKYILASGARDQQTAATVALPARQLGVTDSTSAASATARAEGARSPPQNTLAAGATGEQTATTEASPERQPEVAANTSAASASARAEGARSAASASGPAPPHGLSFSPLLNPTGAATKALPARQLGVADSASASSANASAEGARSPP